MARYVSGWLFALCGLLMGLPQGWCCVSCGDAPCQAPPPAKPKTCCCCPTPCDRCGGPQTTKRPPTSPCQPRICCFRDVAEAKAPEPPEPPVALPCCWLPFEFRPFPAALETGAVNSFLPDPDSTLHLRLCVWRC